MNWKTVRVLWENLLSKYTFVNKADLEVLHCWSGGWWHCSLDRIYNHLLWRKRKTRFLGAGKGAGSFESINKENCIKSSDAQIKQKQLSQQRQQNVEHFCSRSKGGRAP